MNDLQTTTNMTPIEIALQIDENGMTTATKLYEFLELNPSNYSKWYKTNIMDNQFAEENTDYFPFVLKYESITGEKERQDFKLTAPFAKKLSMTQKNHKGEQARNYFIGVEDKLKEVAVSQQSLSPELQMFQSLFNAMAKAELETKQALTQSKEALDRIESIREVVTLDLTVWRDEVNKLLKKIGTALGGGSQYGNVREESYKLFENRMGYDLKIRLTNRKKTMALEGATKTKINNTSYLDIIASEKRMVECYVAIVKEMAIKYGVA